MIQAALLEDRADLVDRLSALRRRVRLLALLRGLGILAVAVSAVIAAGLLLDRLWEVPYALRWGVLALTGCVALAVLLRAVAWPLVRPIRPEEIATLLEARHPELQERLSSAMQLSDGERPEFANGSLLMRELLLKQARQAITRIDVTRAADTTSVRRWAAAGTVTVVLLLSPLLFAGGYRLLLARFFAPWRNLDRASNLYFDVPHGNRTVARGSDVEIDAMPRWRRGTGVHPDVAWLHWKGPAGEDRRQMHWDEDSGSYRATLPHVFQPFRYTVSADRARTREFRIGVVEAPALVSLAATIEPPAYTGRAVEDVDGAVGEIVAFEGSTVQLRMRFNKPVASAEFVWQPEAAPDADAEGGAKPAERPALPVTRTAASPAPDRLSAVFKLTATTSGRFRLHLTDEFSIDNQNDTTRTLRVRPDAPPTVAFADDRTQDEARADDVLRVPVRATDDVAVESLRLHYTVLSGGVASGRIDADADLVGVPSVDHEFEFDLAPLALKEGSLLSLRAAAYDGRPDPAPNETWTDQRLVLITAKADPYGQKQVARRQEQMRETLRQLRDAVAESRELTDELRADAQDSFNQQQAFSREGEVPPLAARQSEIAAQLDRLAALFALQPLFEDLADPTRRVGDEPLAHAAEDLRRTAAAPFDKKPTKLQQASEDLGVAVDQLAKLAGEFERRAELERDLLALQRLADRSGQLAEDVESFEAKRHGESTEAPAEREAQLAAEQERLQAAHQALSGELSDLIERHPELLDAAVQHQLERLRELSHQAERIAEQQEMLASALRDETREAGQTLPEAAVPQLPDGAQPPDGDAAATPPADPPEADSPEQPDLPTAAPRESDPANADGSDSEPSTEAEPPVAPSATDVDQQSAPDSTPELPENEGPPDGAPPHGGEVGEATDAGASDDATAQGDAPAANVGDNAAPTAGAPEDAPPTAPPDAVPRQSEIARRAARLAIETAEQTGLDAPATAAARQFAERASRAACEAAGGQLSAAAATAAQAVAAAQASAAELGDARTGEPVSPQLAQFAQQLAEAQQQAADALTQASQSPAARQAAQQSGQQQLTAAAEAIQQQLGDVLEQLTLNPLRETERAGQVARSHQSVQGARDAMQSSSSEQSSGRFGEAAASATQAAELLRETVASISAVAPQAGESADSPVPPEVGDQVSQASRELDRAGELLAAQQPSGEPRDERTSPHDHDRSPAETAESSDAPGEDAASQTAASGSESQPSGQETSASRSLQQAARALRQAGRGLQPSEASTAAANSSDRDGRGSTEQSEHGTSPRESATGQGVRGGYHAVDLELRLQELSQRNWGELPGELRTELRTATGKRPTGDYARLIKLYFDEISRRQAPELVAPAGEASAP